MNTIEIATEKMLSGKDESIKVIFFTVRQIIAESDGRLVECIKWGMPHFDFKGIMCGIGAFNNHVSIWFHKGGLMSDSLYLFDASIKSKTMGQIKISNINEVDAAGILTYVKEAIEINEQLPSKKKSVKSAKKKTISKLIVSTDFQDALSSNLIAQDFFNSLTTSQQNGFFQHIEEAKTDATKQKRINRNIERLENGLKSIY